MNVSDSNFAANENLVNVKSLERCFDEKIDREMGNNLTLSKIRLKTHYNVTLAIELENR